MSEQTPDQVFALKCELLLSALDGRIEDWIVMQFQSFDSDQSLIGPAALATDVAINEDLSELFYAPALSQSKNPLQVIREALMELSPLLQQLGVPITKRDEHQEQLYPNDSYDFATVVFETFGPDVANAGLEWGAAKAFVALNRPGTGQLRKQGQAKAQ